MELVVKVAVAVELVPGTRNTEVRIPVWSAKVTDPVGVFAPGVELVTVAVKVTDVPAMVELLEVTTVVDVATPVAVDCAPRFKSMVAVLGGNDM